VIDDGDDVPVKPIPVKVTTVAAVNAAGEPKTAGTPNETAPGPFRVRAVAVNDVGVVNVNVLLVAATVTPADPLTAPRPTVTAPAVKVNVAPFEAVEEHVMPAEAVTAQAPALQVHAAATNEPVGLMEAEDKVIPVGPATVVTAAALALVIASVPPPVTGPNDTAPPVTDVDVMVVVPAALMLLHVTAALPTLMELAPVHVHAPPVANAKLVLDKAPFAFSVREEGDLVPVNATPKLTGPEMASGAVTKLPIVDHVRV
jgi:hypothetical protein